MKYTMKGLPMRKLIVMVCLAIFSFSYANTLIASKMNAVKLKYASESFDVTKLKPNAKEYYLEGVDRFAKNIQLFYDEYAIAINELKQELIIFCLLEDKFKNYDRSMGMVDRKEVCQPVYKLYRVNYNNIDHFAIQDGESVLAEYSRIIKMSKEDKLYEYTVQNEREYLTRVISSKYLKSGYGLVEQLYDPDKIE